MIMKDFFKREFELLESKTGFKQYDKILERPTWEKDLDEIIDLMIIETNRPPFDLVGVDVKMRVIQQAIVDDKEFIGLNAKFVRRALATWWQFSKDRYFDKMIERPQEPAPEPVTEEEREKWLKVWQENLRGARSSFTTTLPVLTNQDIEEEGQERPKPAPRYVNNETQETLLMKEKIRKAGREFYKNEPIDSRHFSYFIIDDKYEVFAKSKEDAEQIYLSALT